MNTHMLPGMLKVFYWFKLANKNIYSPHSEPDPHVFVVNNPVLYYVSGLKEKMQYLKSRLCFVCRAHAQCAAACPWEGGASGWS